MKKIGAVLLLVILLAACSQQSEPTQYLSAQVLASSQHDTAFLSVSSNGSHLYVGGETRGSFVAPLQGQVDGVIRKYNGFTPIWTRQFGQPGGITLARSVLANADGSVYIVGEELNYPSPFLSKYDRTGKLLWKKVFPSTSRSLFMNGKEIPHDAQGNLYIQVRNENKYVTNVLKFSATGSLLQTIFIDQTSNPATPQNTYSGDFAVDPAGNLYAVATVFRQFPGTTALQYDGILKRFNSKGQRIYTKNVCATSDNDLIDHIAVDKSGNIYTTCLTYAPDFSSVIGSQSYKLNSSGNVVWSRSGNFSAIALDTQNNSYVTYFTSSRDVYVEKYDPTGNLLWVMSFGGARFESPTSIIVSDFVYVAGLSDDPITFERDPFLAKIRKSDGGLVKIDQ